MSDIKTLTANIQRAVDALQPPAQMTEARQEYWKAGARAAIYAVSEELRTAMAQSRPEAELPEVTDEMVERAAKAAWHGYFANAEDKEAKLTAARKILQAAYGQQCAASRPADVDPSMEPFCVDDVRATAGEGDRSDD